MERKKYLDGAKVIGLLCIVLAHVSPPSIVAQIRNFDVPLMVIVSGILAAGAYERAQLSQPGYFSYVRRRFVRLVLPVWLFLIPFIAGRSLIVRDLSFDKILGSFLLERDSIGYVWIIMVYLICALLVPLLSKVNIHSLRHLAVVSGAYVLFEVACALKLTTTVSALDDILYYIVPYGCVTLLGLNYEKLSRKIRLRVALCALVVFVTMAVWLYLQEGSFVYTQKWKYPARIYYLSYAIAVSLFILEGLQLAPQKLLSNKMVAFISRNSLWIYLWHILMLWLVRIYIWPIRFVLVFAASCFVAFLQEKIVCFLEKKSFPKSLLQVLKG